jgi:hypothetical protein
MNQAKFDMTEPHLVQGHTSIGTSLRKCFQEGRDVVLSSEDLGLVTKEAYHNVFEPLFDNFDLTVVVGYRRFYEWVPSVFFQIQWASSGGYTKWPEDAETPQDFRSWFGRASRTIRMLYTDYYIENWLKIVNTTESIAIYNVHQDNNVAKTFYCSTLGARRLCKKHSAQPPSKMNVGFSTTWDSIAVASYAQGMIAPNSVNRKEAAGHVKSYFSQKNMTALDFSKTCFSELELEGLLNKTKQVESALFPTFYSSKNGQNTMGTEFENLKETKYCTVDTKKVLEKHNFGWGKVQQKREGRNEGRTKGRKERKEGRKEGPDLSRI